MEQRCRLSGIVTLIGILLLVINLTKCYAYKATEIASKIHNGFSDVASNEGKVWAVLPALSPTFTESKYVNDEATTANGRIRKRKTKFRRESGRLQRLIRRQFRRAGTPPTIDRNSMLFLAGHTNSRIYCPHGCVCFNTEVECKFAKLHWVPSGIPIQTEKLSIIGNSLVTLNSSSFQGLMNLKSLVLSNNKIRNIDAGTFANLPRLRRLRLSQNELSTLQEDTFMGLTKLQRIDLRDNRLTCLPANLFQGLSDLSYIYLSRNQLVWLSGSTFADQLNLKHLDLAGNPFQCDCHIRPMVGYFLSSNRLPILLRSGAMCNGKLGEDSTHGQPVNVHLLHQSNCPASDKLQTPAACMQRTTSSCQTVCECSADRTADCQRRGLKTIPQDLPSDLMEINLAHNDLETIPKAAFKNYRNLRKIVLDNNRILQVDRNAFADLPELSSLYMSSNKLQALPPGIFSGLKNLKILYLHRNTISCLQRGSFEGLESLQILHLSENRIQTFPKGSFADLRRLKYLYLVHNPLICDCRMAWLPAFLVEKEAGGTQWARCAEPLAVQGRHVRDLLPTLMPCDNQLVTLKSEEQNCDNIKIQCPEGCRCTEITVTPMIQARPNVPFQLDELGLISDGLSVDCSDLGLTDLPEKIPTNTKDLNLRNNRIREIKANSALNHLPNLQTLLLDGNRVAKIDHLAFRANRDLRKLILSNNSITQFDHRILNGLTELEILLLQHNELTCLNNMTFGETPALKILMLNNNKIRCITKGTFDTMRLESLSLSANPLNCDCHLSWLPDWLRDNVNQVIAGPLPPTCVEPEELAGTPVASLARYHFTCSSKPDCQSAGKSASSVTANSKDSPVCSDQTHSCCNEPAVSPPQADCPIGCTCEADGVYCSDLNLTEIPLGIPQGTTQLYLGRNQITKLDSNRIGYLSKLHTLVLSYNKLRELPENVFETLKNLKTLVLSHNDIQCIHPNAFNGLNGLRVLILQANNISSIPYGTFNKLVQLNNIALGQNPLHCDCNGKWLNSYFRQQFLDNGIALCHSPESMRLKSLYHSKPGDFVCPWIRRIEHNQSKSREDLTNALFVDEHATDSETQGYEPSWWWTNAKKTNPTDWASMSPEERESRAIAAKCLPCMLDPCLNGGKCTALGQLDFQCSCPAPYHGKRCELEEHVCLSNPCQNGGKCEITTFPNGYRCVCPKGFQGHRCEQPVKHCLRNYCENGGTCEIVENEYRCHCAPGFHGKQCQYAFIYCKDLNPCLNGGKCNSLPENKYSCECTKGWTGKTCQTNVDDCLYNRCENGATCIDGINEYICKCRPGYAGIYCERPTWNPENYVTRMDRRLPATHRLRGFSSYEVRHSPIKIRSLSTPHMETLCAYHQCQNKATCVENQGDVYQCVCNPGFSGQYCEHLFSISLPSTHSYIAIVPPSRGALVPRGSVSFRVNTRSTSGILMYYAELENLGKNDAPEQYLLIDLDDGYVRAIFPFAKNVRHQRRSTFRINDGQFHTIKLNVESNNMTLTVDDLVQISSKETDLPAPVFNESEQEMAKLPKPRFLALTNPLYFGGAPADRLEAVSRILNQQQVVGMTGCIQDVQINERSIDLARLFGAPVDKMTDSEEHYSERPSAEAKQHGTAIGILPGCYAKLRTTSGHSAQPTSSVRINNQSERLDRNGTPSCFDLRTCANGGKCVRQSHDLTQYACECPDGYTGPFCEHEQSCQRSSQRSFIRDPQTNCISTRKLSVRTCAGSCIAQSTNVADSITHDADKSVESENAQSLWLPETSLRRKRADTEQGSSCCQPTKVRHRRVQFQCPNGSTYERTVKLVKRCGCIQCTRQV